MQKVNRQMFWDGPQSRECRLPGLQSYIFSTMRVKAITQRVRVTPTLRPRSGARDGALGWTSRRMRRCRRGSGEGPRNPSRVTIDIGLRSCVSLEMDLSMCATTTSSRRYTKPLSSTQLMCLAGSLVL